MLQTMTKDNTPENILQLANAIVEKEGKANVAESLDCSPQAIGKALQPYDNPFKYFDLRVKILALHGHKVSGPYFDIHN